MKNILVRHVGNMGDLVFFVPPILETVKRKHPESHITLVTAWGFKDKRTGWGKRNQDGFCIALMATNPHIDQLIHYHDTKTVLDGSMCIEEGVAYPTWSKTYYEKQKASGLYDAVFELDIGIGQDENPIKRLYEHVGMPEESYANYKIYFTEKDLEVAKSVIENFPRPRIVLLESIEGTTTRGWDPGKIPELESRIEARYGQRPLWFGAKFAHQYNGRPLTLRENIATLSYCDVGIGVLSGPLHFAAAVGLPTLTLFCDQPLYRAAPEFFLNQYISQGEKKHRTVLGPSGPVYTFLKEGATKNNLTPSQWASQGYEDWTNPGRQSTKSCLSVITVDEVMTALADMVHT